MASHVEKKKRLTVAQRVEIVERLKAGESLSRLAVEFGVSQPAVSNIKKNSENVLAIKNTLEEQHASMSKKRYTGLEDSPFEIRLFKWFLRKQNLGQPISGPLLKKKALLFNKLLGGPEKFKASNGWLEKFKKRHSISQQSMLDEEIESDAHEPEIIIS